MLSWIRTWERRGWGIFVGHKREACSCRQRKVFLIIAEREIKGKIKHDVSRVTFLKSHGVGGRTLVPQRYPHSWSPGSCGYVSCHSKRDLARVIQPKTLRAGIYPGSSESSSVIKRVFKRVKGGDMKTEAEVRVTDNCWKATTSQGKWWPLETERTRKQRRSLPIPWFYPTSDFWPPEL